jgi:hypothetical protein
LIRRAPPSPTAALAAGIPLGMQAQGVWAGRRQLFVRFAAEAETATMYTAEAFADELQRVASRSRVHSVAISGRDPLGGAPFLAATFFAYKPQLPVMLDTDGQRPEAIPGLRQYLTMVQVTLDFPASKPVIDRAVESVAVAAGTGHMHGLVLAPRADTADGQILRVIEQAHAASAGTMIVVHPSGSPSGLLDRRWSDLLDQALGVHGDVRVALRIPPPAGMR